MTSATSFSTRSPNMRLNVSLTILKLSMPSTSTAPPCPVMRYAESATRRLCSNWYLLRRPVMSSAWLRFAMRRISLTKIGCAPSLPSAPTRPRERSQT